MMELVLPASGKITSNQQGVLDSDRQGFFCRCGVCRTRIDFGTPTTTGKRSLSHSSRKLRCVAALKQNSWKYDRQLGWLCPGCSERDDLPDVKRNGIPKGD